MASSLHHMAASISERSKALINNDLRKILKEEGSYQTGNKAALQARVLNLITNAVQHNDTELLRRLQYRVQHHGDAPPPAHETSSTAPPLPQNSMPAAGRYNMTTACIMTPLPVMTSQQQQMSIRPTHLFKESPFFEIRELLMGNIVLEASPNHRQNVNRALVLSDTIAARLKSDSSLRLLLFSALEQPLSPYMRLDIAFPSQIEVRINGADIKGNYRGLKNRPGSTRPADITQFVCTTPANHRNSLAVTYALTHKNYNLSVFMAKKFSVEELTRRVMDHNVITRQSVLTEMMKNASSSDIEVGSSVMSLKDPISTLRIKIPCRSAVCTHNQCFDVESFLQLQEQAPTWICPICSKTISYEGLAVDQYVEDILSKARNVDQVTIEPNGEWLIEKDMPLKSDSSSARADEGDDEIVEIPTYRIGAIKSEAGFTPKPTATPPQISRETSTAPRSSNKRISEVIDLTMSDDDDDDKPSRPAKKVAYNTPYHIPDASRWYHLQSLGSSNAAIRSRALPHSYHNMSSGAHSIDTYTSATSPHVPYGSHSTLSSDGRIHYSEQGKPTYPVHFDPSP